MIKLKDILEGKFDIHNSKDFIFITYGGLSLTKQKGHKSASAPDLTPHSPPAKRGIYAFVWPYIERFLLGGEYANPKYRGKGQRNRIQYVRDKDGNIIDSNHPDFEKYSEKGKNCNFPIYKDPSKRPRANSFGLLGPNDDDEWVAPERWVLYNNVKPKKFKYSGDIWHHLADVPEYSIINRHGNNWVKTDMETFKKAFRKEAPNVDDGYFSMDHLEVFIEGKI
jgi:hypothetical protein